MFTYGNGISFCDVISKQYNSTQFKQTINYDVMNQNKTKHKQIKCRFSEFQDVFDNKLRFRDFEEFSL